MKKMMKRTAAILLCAMASLAAAGCGAAETSGIVTKDYEDAPQITLSVLTSKTLTDEMWKDGFTASNGTQVRVVEYSSDYYAKENLSYRELVLKRLESNVDIDCYVIQAEDVIAFSQKNYWMDLSALPAVDSLSDDALKQSTYDGKVFSIPLTYTGFGFFWNVDMLAEHGLTVPGNLSEFLHVCETLKLDGITPYLSNKGFALTVPAMAKGFAGLYASDDSAAKLASLADGTTPVSAYMADGFAFVEMLIDKGYMDPEQAMNTTPREADITDFLAGKGAFFCGTMQAIENADFEIAMTGIPALEDGTVAVVGANHRMAINPNSPHVEYATELLNATITPEWLAQAAASDQALSSGKGEYDLSYLREEFRDFARLVQSGGQIPNQDFSIPFNTWEAIRDLCREICAGATAADAAKAYDAIQKEQIAAARE